MMGRGELSDADYKLVQAVSKIWVGVYLNHFNPADIAGLRQTVLENSSAPAPGQVEIPIEMAEELEQALNLAIGMAHTHCQDGVQELIGLAERLTNALNKAEGIAP